MEICSNENLKEKKIYIYMCVKQKPNGIRNTKGDFAGG